MVWLHAVLSQHFRPEALPAAVRATLGKPLRRAATLTQLALLGALACLPPGRRQLPAALLWQSTSGPRQETMVLLDEICNGAAEPMPYDFLATQPAIAAASIHPFLPGLRSAMHFPLESEGSANWSLLLTLAADWLAEGRYAQVLCAHLDSWDGAAVGHWLVLGNTPLENPPVRLQLDVSVPPAALPDTPRFPLQLAAWSREDKAPALALLSTVTPGLALEFARL